MYIWWKVPRFPSSLFNPLPTKAKYVQQPAAISQWPEFIYSRQLAWLGCWWFHLSEWPHTGLGRQEVKNGHIPKRGHFSAKVNISSFKWSSVKLNWNFHWGWWGNQTNNEAFHKKSMNISWYNTNVNKMIININPNILQTFPMTSKVAFWS